MTCLEKCFKGVYLTPRL